jgi:hypothetical protein
VCRWPVSRRGGRPGPAITVKGHLTWQGHACRRRRQGRGDHQQLCLQRQQGELQHASGWMGPADPASWRVPGQMPGLSIGSPEALGRWSRSGHSGGVANVEMGICAAVSRHTSPSRNSRACSGAYSTLPGTASQTYPGCGSGFMASGFRSSTGTHWVGSPGRFQANPGGTLAQRLRSVEAMPLV